MQEIENLGVSLEDENFRISGNILWKVLFRDGFKFRY